MVYKTRGDYSKLLPVRLSGNKKSVVAFPSPAEATQRIRPTALAGGYWTSSAYIFPSTAYVLLTIDDYSSFKMSPPTADDLFFLIKDKDPFTELWDCGATGAHSVAQLNELVSSGSLKLKCRKLK